MTSVERVKAICKERKIPISRLEKELGYANGYIGQLRKGVFPDDRLVSIANYLNVSAEFLLTGEEKAPASMRGSQISDDDIKFALWGDTTDIDDKDLEDVKRYAAFVRERKKRND